MKKLILKIVLFACIAFSAVESKAFDTQFNWNNTSNCTNLTVKVYDAANNLLYSTSTCCGIGVCITTGIPAYVTITDNSCSTTIRVDFNLAPTSCATCSGCCIATGGTLPGSPVQMTASYGSGGSCGTGSFQLTVTTL